MRRKLDRVTVLDILLIAALVFLPGWALVRSWRATDRQPAAYVYQGGRLLGVYRLNQEQVIVIGDEVKPDMKLISGDFRGHCKRFLVRGGVAGLVHLQRPTAHGFPH